MALADTMGSDHHPLGARGYRFLGAVIGVGISGAYAAAYPLLGVGLPFGWDSPVYVWWARVAGSSGLAAPSIGARPGSVGLVASLASVLGVQTSTVIAALIPVVVAAAALAGAEFICQCVGFTRLRYVLAALLLAASMWLLAAGYLSTLVFAAEFLAGLAALARARSTTSPRTAVGGLLFGLGGAAHPLFMVWAAATVLAAVALMVCVSRSREVVRFAMAGLAAVVAGSLITAGALLVTGGLHASALEFSRDGMLKDIGLSSLSIPFHSDKMWAAMPFFGTLMVSALLCMAYRRDLVGLWRHSRSVPGLFFVALSGVWIGGTLISCVLLGASVPAPAQRLVIFCLPLPMLTAIGAEAVLRRASPAATAPFLRRMGRRLLVTITVIVLLVAAFSAVEGWYVESSGSIASDGSLVAQQTIAAAVASTPAGSPVVIAVDGPDDRYIAKDETLVRTELPPARVSDVHFFVGSAADLEARRVRSVGIPERDRLAVEHWAEVRPLLGRHPLVLAVVSHDPSARWQALAPHVFELRTAGTLQISPQAVHSTTDRAGLADLTPNALAPFLLAPFLAAALGLIGMGLAGRFSAVATGFGASLALGFGLMMAAAVAVSAGGLAIGSTYGRLAISGVVIAVLGAPTVQRFRRIFRRPTPAAQPAASQPRV